MEPLENTTHQKNNYAQEHAVIINFHYPNENLEALHDLELKLIKVITDNNVGEYDGHEVAIDDTHATLYMYGPNAENLFKVIKPTLEESSFMKGAIANLRFGPNEKGVLELDVEIE